MAMKRDAQANDAAKAANGAATSGDHNTIEQVRELLFGSTKRGFEQHLDDLDKKVEARIADLRSELLDRLSALEARLIDAERESEAKRLASFKDIGAAIADLGSTINNLGSKRAGR